MRIRSRAIKTAEDARDAEEVLEKPREEKLRRRYRAALLAVLTRDEPPPRLHMHAGKLLSSQNLAR
jgi:hypothetical protein